MIVLQKLPYVWLHRVSMPWAFPSTPPVISSAHGLEIPLSECNWGNLFNIAALISILYLKGGKKDLIWPVDFYRFSSIADLNKYFQMVFLSFLGKVGKSPQQSLEIIGISHTTFSNKPPFPFLVFKWTKWQSWGNFVHITWFVDAKSHDLFQEFILQMSFHCTVVNVHGGGMGEVLAQKCQIPGPPICWALTLN